MLLSSMQCKFYYNNNNDKIKKTMKKIFIVWKRTAWTFFIYTVKPKVIQIPDIIFDIFLLVGAGH